ncbi:MAG: Flagellar basal body rod protein FlgB [Verrucomicrobiota bacterium]|jgi:flagellar basal-body rod protein FlgB
MIQALFTQPNYLGSKKLLDVTALRQEAIASNLANAETPNYKRLDVAGSFQSEFQRAMLDRSPGQVAALQPKLEMDPKAVAHRLDGNTVQLETELAELQKNSLEHSLGTQLVTGSLLRLRLAITGRPV